MKKKKWIFDFFIMFNIFYFRKKEKSQIPVFFIEKAKIYK